MPHFAGQNISSSPGFERAWQPTGMLPILVHWFFVVMVLFMHIMVDPGCNANLSIEPGNQAGHICFAEMHFLWTASDWVMIGWLQVAVSRQRSAFPPNFVHSLDGSHMMMTALACKRAQLNFAGWEAVALCLPFETILSFTILLLNHWEDERGGAGGLNVAVVFAFEGGLTKLTTM